MNAREEVLREFEEPVSWVQHQRMADEIVRLREQLAYFRDFENGFRKTFGELALTTDPNVVRQLVEKNKVLYHRTEQMERVVEAAKVWVEACETDEAITASSAWDNLTAPEYIAACDALTDAVTALNCNTSN